MSTRLLSLLAFVFFLYPFPRVTAQTVMDADDYPLPGASVSWPGGGTTTEADGSFTIPAGTERVVISYLGFISDTITVAGYDFSRPIVLEEQGSDLDAVTVTAKDRGGFASLLATQNIEQVTSQELRRAPCCSLGESFENSPAVDLAYGDPLTGRREIQMLGLSGNYSLLTLEKRPFLTGFAAPYALDYIPGTWADGLQISKGAASPASGAGGMTGQINTELIKPIGADPLFVNLFAASQGRGEVNVHLNEQLGEKLYGGALLHTSFTENDRDPDGDGFENMIDRRTSSGLLRLFRNAPDANWEGQWNVLGVRDRRGAGQLETFPNPYRISQANNRLEAWGKTGFFGFGKDHQSVGTIYSLSVHRMNNRYGRRLHTGNQRSAYFNGLYQTQIADERHQLTLGAGVTADRFEERFDETIYDREETTVGAFGEYTFQSAPRPADLPQTGWSLILALRADHHNLGGLQFSPRANLRLQTGKRTAFRLTAGRGWRSPDLLVENQQWLASSRNLVLRGGEDAANPGFLGLETAWNFGLTFTRDFELAGREGQVSLDLYRTDFQDRILFDVEQDADNLFLYRSDGRNFANGALASLNYEVLPDVDVRLAYKVNDSQVTYRDGRQRLQPLTPRTRLLLATGYNGERIQADLNYQFIGRQRLPDHGPIRDLVDFPHPQESDGFGLLNGQLTYVLNSHWEVYGGAENVTGLVQNNAIIGADDPFDGPYFDAGRVYQPLFGRRFYLGTRFTL